MVSLVPFETTDEHSSSRSSITPGGEMKLTAAEYASCIFRVAKELTVASFNFKSL